MYPEIEKIKSILVKESYISNEDSLGAEAVAKNSRDYVDYLIRQQLLTKALLGQALAEYYDLPFADLRVNPVDKANIGLIPEEIASKYRVVFVKASDTVAAVATDQPEKLDKNALDQLFAGKQLRVAYSLPEYIDAALTLYDKPLETRFSSIISSGEHVAPEILDEILSDALAYQASDIHFEPQVEDVIVRFRFDGALREAGRLPKENYENILNRIKVESGMRIDEHLSAQDGAIQRRGDNLNVDLRISLVPTVNGEKVVMRVLGSYIQDYTLSDVGLSETHRAKLEEYSKRPFGMILAVGPTGSGKTTTLYSVLKLLNQPNVNVTTIEDPVEYKIPGINQIQVRESSQMTFAKGLRSIVRQDPDVVLVGEIRDEETAEISVNAALTGHLLLSTFHSNDAATAIPRLVDIGIEPFLLASTLEVIIAQRLVRKICDHCKHSVALEAAFSALKSSAKAIILDHFKGVENLYAGKGCGVCSGTGYNGRTAIFEMIDVSPKMEELIIKSPSSQDITKLAREEGFVGMFEDGIEKTKAGLTTVDEVLRVVEPPKKS